MSGTGSTQKTKKVPPRRPTSTSVTPSVRGLSPGRGPSNRPKVKKTDKVASTPSESIPRVSTLSAPNVPNTCAPIDIIKSQFQTIVEDSIVHGTVTLNCNTKKLELSQGTVLHCCLRNCPRKVYTSFDLASGGFICRNYEEFIARADLILMQEVERHFKLHADTSLEEESLRVQRLIDKVNHVKKEDQWSYKYLQMSKESSDIRMNKFFALQNTLNRSPVSIAPLGSPLDTANGVLTIEIPKKKKK